MKRATLEEMKAATAWTSDRLARHPPTPATAAHAMWVNIPNRWYVMSEDLKTVGEFLTVTKRDGSTQDVLIEQIVGTFEDKVIYKVKKDASA